jgi:hypothetical protein
MMKFVLVLVAGLTLVFLALRLPDETSGLVLAGITFLSALANGAAHAVITAPEALLPVVGMAMCCSMPVLLLGFMVLGLGGRLSRFIR